MCLGPTSLLAYVRACVGLASIDQNYMHNANVNLLNEQFILTPPLEMLESQHVVA